MSLRLATAVGSLFDQEKYGSRALELITTFVARKVVPKTVIMHFDNVNILKQISNADADTSFGSDSSDLGN